jgi:glutathione S-transferase
MTSSARMKRPTLVIGNKNYSSWSLRPWLAMKQAGIAFDEIRVPLYADGSKQRLLQYSPSGKVPVLIDGDLTVWDSLAICEYLAEAHPSLWPQDATARAVARSVSAEMHSGFASLRTHMSMNIRKDYVGMGMGTGVGEDVARVSAIWEDCRLRFGAEGAFLFGQFSIADAMYAPVVTRFITYGVAPPATLRPYLGTMLGLPALQEWIAAAKTETEAIPDADIYG